MIHILCGMTVIILIAYLVKIYSRRSSPETTCIIGKLRKIIIYPLAGGIPYEVQEATCSEYGLHQVDLEDRSYVAYAPRTGVALLNLHDLNIGTQDIDILLNKIKESRSKPRTLKEVPIYYLGTRIKMEDLGDDVAAVAQTTFKYSSSDMRIAYLSPENRIEIVNIGTQAFNEDSIEEVDYRSPYYSHYTLVNSKSLEYLHEETRRNTAPSVFRANLVFEGSLPKFGEDKISCLSIGNDVQFNNFECCNHPPTAFATPQSGSYLRHEEPYKFLERTRKMKDGRRPPYYFKYPSFGRNMSLSSPGQIKLGDDLTATIYTR